MSVLGRVLLVRPEPAQELMLTTYRRMGLGIVIADDPASPLAGLGDRLIPLSGAPVAPAAGGLPDESAELEGAVAAFHARYPIDAIVTTRDRLLPAVGRLNEALGLGGVDRAAAEHCFSRRLQYKALRDAGVRIPRYHSASSPGQLDNAARELGYPLVVKSADRSADHPAVRIDGPKDLPAALAESGLAGRPGGLLAEEYLAGPAFTVESVTFRGHTSLLALCDQVPTASPHFARSETVVPGGQPEEVRQEAARQAAAALRALGITEGVTHVEFRDTPDGPAVVGVDGRVAGSCVAEMVEDALQVNLYAQHWRTLTGWAPRVGARYRHHCAGRALRPGPGRLHAVGLGRLPHWDPDELRTVRIWARPGDQLGPVDGRSDLRGWVVACGADAAAARRTADRMRHEISFDCGRAPEEHR